ncbi:hypothetical protein [Methylomonas albis]|jgi:hypothetical protein|uniref:PEP-CTERM sorting domain-containing protein n=1 Tax=Methylomonas albis TaxID=1854563 RepID=A0ABR9CX30_9GAMM|nr:hypothetical protein [Methylomonas albis]MBD9355270.1 hypothetical protein [Methylomonas albis]
MKNVKRQGYQLAAAICLMAGISNAQAAINNGASSIQAGGTGSAGELYLNVWDQAASTSYSIDLGVTVGNFLSGNLPTTFGQLDQRFINWAATTSDPLIFNVAGNNSYVPFANSANGVLLSRRTGATEPGGITLSTLGTWESRVRDRANALNIAEVAQNPGATATDYAANLSEVTTTGASSYFGYTFWTQNMGISGWNGSAKVRNSGVEDETLDFYFVHSPGGTVGTSTRAIFEKLEGKFSLDIADAKLVWTPTVTAVPLPGAVWLFLGGLVSLLRLQKRAVAAV